MGKEIAACCIFHDNCQVLVCQKALLKAHDMRVYQHGVVEELPLYVLCHLPLKTVKHREETQSRGKAVQLKCSLSAMQYLRECYPG